MLEVRGRKTGAPRRTPVNLLTLDGRRYLVAPRGHTQWVRNLRAAGEGELLLGRRRERFVGVEVPTARRSRSCARTSGAGSGRSASSSTVSTRTRRARSFGASRPTTRSFGSRRRCLQAPGQARPVQAVSVPTRTRARRRSWRVTRSTSPPRSRVGSNPCGSRSDAQGGEPQTRTPDPRTGLGWVDADIVRRVTAEESSAGPRSDAPWRPLTGRRDHAVGQKSFPFSTARSSISAHRVVEEPHHLEARFRVSNALAFRSRSPAAHRGRGPQGRAASPPLRQSGPPTGNAPEATSGAARILQPLYKLGAPFLAARSSLI